MRYIKSKVYQLNPCIPRICGAKSRDAICRGWSTQRSSILLSATDSQSLGELVHTSKIQAITVIRHLASICPYGVLII